MVEEKIGIVEHFFTNVSVAAIKITDGELKVGAVSYTHLTLPTN